MSAGWTEDHILACFFGCFELVFERSIGGNDRAAITAAIGNANNVPKVGKQINYVIDLYARILGTAPRDRATLLQAAQVLLEDEFETDAANGRTHIMASVRDALRNPGSLGGHAVENPRVQGSAGGAMAVTSPQPANGYVGSPAAQQPLPGAPPYQPAHGAGVFGPGSNAGTLNYQQMNVNRMLEENRRNAEYELRMIDLRQARDVIANFGR